MVVNTTIMTLDGFFRGLGDIFLWTFNILENDVPITWAMNTGIVLLISGGLLYWLSWQKKLNKQAENNPDQLK